MVRFYLMDGTQITPRQQRILDILLREGSLLRAEIADRLPEDEVVSKMTLTRDLQTLLRMGLITLRGRSRATRYVLTEVHPLLSFIDLQKYFLKGPDEREVFYRECNPKVFSHLHDLLTKEDIALFDAGSTQFFKKMQQHSDVHQRKELQRFVIEFSWKSSRIEGNTYSLLETEELIARRSEAQGHPHAEAIMIVNHKDVFDHILTYRRSFRDVSVKEICSVHAILTKDLSIEQGIRTNPVRIIGTTYAPPLHPKEIESALAALANAASKARHPAERAFILLAGIAYIQPFEDGNKRTSRMISNAVLLAHDLPPLSYRSIDEIEYKQAVIAWYERRSLYHLKRLFMEQFQFAARTYFRE